MTRILFFCSFSVCVAAQTPLIYNRGVVNSASFMPQRLSGGAIAQGSVFSIFGTNLGPVSGVQQPSYPLSTTLGGASITVSQGGAVVNAIPIYVSSVVINAIMPSNAPLGLASVRVKVGNSPLSNPMTVNIGPTAFGIYTANGTGIGPGILQNFVSATSQPINSPTLAAQPGQAMTLWGTGLGAVQSDANAPPIGNLATKVEVFIGGVPVTNFLYNGRTPCCSGIDQIVFTIPNNAPQGCWVPVFVRTGGTTVSNVVTMAITPDGSSCLLGPAAPPFVTSGRFGGFLSLRVATHEDIGTKSVIDVTGDYTTAIAYQVSSSAFPFHPVLSTPPPGTCTAYATKGDWLRGDTLPGAIPSGGKPLDFGAGFSLSGPGGMKVIQNLLAAAPLNYLGGSVTGNFFSNRLFLQPGSYNLAGSGGNDVRSFSAAANMPQPISWTNRDQLIIIDRTQPLNVSWEAGPAQVAVVGFGVDLPNDSSSAFACLAPPGATSFTVPSAMLANLPATRPNPLQSKSVIYLVNLPAGSAAATFSASGLDSAFAAFLNAAGKTVVFQ